MLSDDIIEAELEVCRQQRKQIQNSKSKLREWELAFSHQEKALHALRQSQQKLDEKQEELKPALRGVQMSLLHPDADGRRGRPPEHHRLRQEARRPSPGGDFHYLRADASPRRRPPGTGTRRCL